MSAVGRAPAAPRSGERFARRVVTGCAVLVVAACFGFSFGNVLALGRYLDVPEWVAWLVAPAVDLTVVGLIVGVRHLSLRGVEGRRLRPARLLLVAAGLTTWALNTAYALFVRRHLGVVAYDSLAPLLLIGWAEVGPWFLRQFRTATVNRPLSGRPGRPEASPATRADQQPTAASGRLRRPPGTQQPPEAPAPLGRVAASQTATTAPAGDRALLDRARALNAAHWQTHGRQISRDKLRAALGIGATRAERLLAALATDPASSRPTPLPGRVAPVTRRDQWPTPPTPLPVGSRQGDGQHG
jgi:hypothetical protein